MSIKLEDVYKTYLANNKLKDNKKSSKLIELVLLKGALDKLLKDIEA